MNNEKKKIPFKRSEEEKTEMREHRKITNGGAGEELADEIISTLNNKGSNTPSNNNEDELEWEAPIPFDTYNLPTFDSSIFSPTIKNMVDSVAEFTQTPVDLAAICAIGVLSTTFAKKIATEVYEGWMEPVNTYTTVFMESSNRKSAVFDTMTEPVYLYENDHIDEMKSKVNKRKAERASLEKRIEKLQNDYAKTNDPAIKEEINEVVDELEKIPELFLPSLILDNATEEVIISRLKQNSEIISIMSDEGDLFERLKVKGNDHEKLDVYLKGYSGGHIRVDRISRATERLDNPLITICISAQPTVIQSMPAKMNTRGVTPRFLFSIPQDFMGYRDIFADPVPKEIKDRYIGLIKKMLNFSVKEPVVLTFDEQAKDELSDFRAEVEANFRDGGIFHDHLKAWGGKLVGQIVRIAGLLHVSKYAETAACMEEIPTTIDKGTMTNAIKLKDYFIPHAEKAFGIMKQNELLVDAQFLLDKLLEKQVLVTSRQEIWQATRSRFKIAEHFNQAMNVLETRYYIQRTFGGKSGRKELININPLLLESTYSEPKRPNTAQSLENKEKKEGNQENLEIPNSPKSNTKNNKLNANNTPNEQKYKVVKEL